MTLLSHRYGKGRVRVMRVSRGPVEQVREASLEVILHGGDALARAYTHADNRAVIATDTVKNLVNLVAREHVEADAEHFALAVGRRFLDRYAHVARVTVTSHETRWVRASLPDPHPHTFTLDGNGRPLVLADLTREAAAIRSGIRNYTFLKSTGSGFEDFLRDDATTLPETGDRIAATSMDATWRWSAAPPSYGDGNARVLRTMLGVFAATYSASLQDSLYRMGEAALAAVPEIDEISLACPNKHYLPIDLAPLGASADNMVFTPSDEPHGQIECTVGR